jgi:hypothetical protein
MARPDCQLLECCMDGTSKRVTDAFSWLKALGFQTTRSDDGQRESSTQFESSKVRVGVLVDHWGSVNIHIGLLRDGGVLAENYGLCHVVMDSAPDAVESLSAGSLTERLAAQAELLKTHAADLLSGDFSRRDRLRRIRAEQTRISRKEHFGTSTGETPRFTERPSLDELFSEADNEGIRDARCVQAYWDYDYSLSEVGTFLSESDDEVQARLDRWDGV